MEENEQSSIQRLCSGSLFYIRAFKVQGLGTDVLFIRPLHSAKSYFDSFEIFQVPQLLKNLKVEIWFDIEPFLGLVIKFQIERIIIFCFDSYYFPHRKTPISRDRF